MRVKKKSTGVVFFYFMLLIGFFFIITSCHKTEEYTPNENYLLVQVQFRGDAIPKIGNELVLEVYYSNMDRKEVRFGEKEPDVIKKRKLGEDDINIGLDIALEKPGEYSAMYIAGYVDIDQNSNVGDGDIAVFYKGLPYDSVRSDSLRYDKVKDDTINNPINVINKHFIAMNMTKAIGVGKNGVVDIDGNGYRTVKIGDQIWMAENLRVTHYRNGDPIAHGLSNEEWEGNAPNGKGAYGVYPYQSAGLSTEHEMIEFYGLLYNAWAVLDDRKIAPVGWRVPTDEDWKKLEVYIGASEIDINKTDWRGQISNKLMAEGEMWKGASGRDVYGFSVFPAGFRHRRGSFKNFGERACFWTSTPSDDDPNRTWRRNFRYNKSGIQRNEWYNKEGYSVRCIKIRK